MTSSTSKMKNADEQGPKSRTGAVCNSILRHSHQNLNGPQSTRQLGLSGFICSKYSRRRGGSNRNLANVILKRLTGLKDNPTAHQTPNINGLTILFPIKTHVWLQLSPANWKPATSGPLSACSARTTFPRQQTPKRCQPCRTNIHPPLSTGILLDHQREIYNFTFASFL